MVLKHYLRGLAFLLAATAGLAAAVVEAARMALEIIANLDMNRVMIDPNQIYLAARQAVAQASGLFFKLAVALVLISWIVGTVDAYLLGRRLDRTRPFQEG